MQSTGITSSASSHPLHARCPSSFFRVRTNAAASVGQKNSFRCSQTLSFTGANSPTSGTGHTSYRKCSPVPARTAIPNANQNRFFINKPSRHTL